jgi:hypothetical protein
MIVLGGAGGGDPSRDHALHRAAVAAHRGATAQGDLVAVQGMVFAAAMGLSGYAGRGL